MRNGQPSRRASPCRQAIRCAKVVGIGDACEVLRRWKSAQAEPPRRHNRTGGYGKWELRARTVRNENECLHQSSFKTGRRIFQTSTRLKLLCFLKSCFNPGIKVYNCRGTSWNDFSLVTRFIKWSSLQVLWIQCKREEIEWIDRHTLALSDTVLG